MRVSKKKWVSDFVDIDASVPSADVCSNFESTHFNTMSIKSVLQYPSNRFLSVILTLQNVKELIYAQHQSKFVTVSVTSGGSTLVMKQNLFGEETDLVTFLDDHVDGAKTFKVKLFVDFKEEDFPVDSDYFVNVEVDQRDKSGADEVWDCVTLRH